MKKIESLNLIRIVSALLILLFHSRIHYGFFTNLLYVDEIISIGAIGVTAFIMLSGFGLRRSYGGISLVNKEEMYIYLKKRIIGIFPIWLFMMTFAIISQYRIGSTIKEIILLIPAQLSMLEVLFNPTTHYYFFNDNCWFLSTLFVLYLLFPYLNQLINFLSIKQKIWLGIILAIISEYIYALNIYVCTENPFLQYYVNPLYRIPEFCIGIILADLVVDEKVQRVFEGEWKIIVALLLAVLGIHRLFPYFITFYNLYNIITIPLVAICILCMVNSKFLNILGGIKIIKFISKIGLEIYLCQSFAIYTMERVVFNINPSIMYIILTICYAILVHVIFVRPITKYLMSKFVERKIK